jgi:4-amino-4-deoxy-L-arabinose transferase-like glycosyltransferase
MQARQPTVLRQLQWSEKSRMQHLNKGAWLTLATVLLLPLASMAIVPLYDTSEPRYAEIARIMAQTGDWITPWFSPGVPFWGKPPLSFWAQALSMKTFGLNEFAARFPSWLCLLLSNGILLAGLRSLLGPRIAFLSAIVYSTCTLVYISSGAVLTDPFLALGTTLSLVSFAVVIHMRGQALMEIGDERNELADTRGKFSYQWWQYGFFVGLAVGLLAKGPLAVVVSIAPVAVWYVLNRKVISTSTVLPWSKGLALMAVLCVPWYVLAEIKTPGFLNYFIVGEHFRRFLDPGWSGDLYGSAHRRVYGTIWLYWIPASFPWGGVMLGVIIGALRSVRLRSALKATARYPFFSYWLASALFTPLLFTFSANILWTYLLPSLAGFSILVAIMTDQIEKQFGDKKIGVFTRTVWVACIVPVVILGLSITVWAKPDLRNTERSLVRYVTQQGEPAIPLRYFSTLPFSAQFYSAGQARELNGNDLRRLLELGTTFYLAVPKGEQKIVADILGKPFKQLYANKRYILIRVPF